MTNEEKRIARIMLELWDINHFSLEEVFPHEFPPFYMAENLMPTLYLLNYIRIETETPIIITSTYRSPERNKQVGGSPQSLHLANNAIDWKFAFEWPGCYRGIYKEIISGEFITRFTEIGKNIHFTPDILGVGLYNNFIHLDTRGLLKRKSPARWDFSKHIPEYGRTQ